MTSQHILDLEEEVARAVRMKLYSFERAHEVRKLIREDIDTAEAIMKNDFYPMRRLEEKIAKLEKAVSFILEKLPKD